MERTIFRFVLRYSLRQQILVMLLTGASMPFVYLALEVPKRIINEAIGGHDIPPALLGFELDQVSYLFVLCALFLLLIVINGGFKYVLNVYRGVLGEQMLRRLRFQLYGRLLRFPLPHFKHMSAGEVIPMITAETEPLGGFIGDAFALPAFQGGLLVTYLVFIFNQDPVLGMVATSMYPLQAFVIPRLQKKVNLLARQRVLTVRSLADRVGESVAGITDIHANDTSRFERAQVSRQLGRIFTIRLDIYKRKFFIKFFNNFLNQVTPFFFYSAGGYFVIMGELSLGALVAALAAYKDVASPWNELLKFYQIKEDVRVKYDQIIEQFDPPGLLPQERQDTEPEAIGRLEGEVIASNLSYSEDGVTMLLDGVNLRFRLGDWVALVGGPNSGKQELGRILGGLLDPSDGRVELAGRPISSYPEAVLGRRIGYLEFGSFLFSGSVRDNLYYGLKHRPLRDPEHAGEAALQRQRELRFARQSGNSELDPDADWIEYAAAGAADEADLERRSMRVLEIVELRDDLFQLGLRSVIAADSDPELVARLLEARHRLHDELSKPEYRELVEPFDAARYNDNASLAENLLFGSVRDVELGPDHLAANAYVQQVLREADLFEDLTEVGRQVAQTMVELFADLPPGHEFFQQYSFIGSDDLPEYQALLGRIDKRGAGMLEPAERTQLLALAFRLVRSRHRLGLLNDEIRHKMVAARRLFSAGLPASLQGSIEFFDNQSYNAAISVQDNVLFGRLAYGQAYAETRVGTLMRETIQRLELREAIIGLGMDYPVGIGGSRLSQEQRQKIGLARCLLKHPDMLVVNGATNALDAAAERRVMARIREEFDLGALWVLDRPELAELFDQVAVIDDGRVAEDGKPAALSAADGALTRMLRRN